METSGSASLATVVNAALQQQQFGFKVLKQQGQVVSELMSAATEMASSSPSPTTALNGRGGTLNVQV